MMLDESIDGITQDEDMSGVRDSIWFDPVLSHVSIDGCGDCMNLIW